MNAASLNVHETVQYVHETVQYVDQEEGCTI